MVKNKFSELIAPAMNRVWRRRVPKVKPLVSTGHYDADYNLVVADKNRLGVTELYVLTDKALNQVPCSRLERIMMVISSSPHQSLLLLHINLQGNSRNVQIKSP